MFVNSAGPRQNIQRLLAPNRLVRDITLDDLSENDLEVLGTGIQQYLPQRDHANRMVTIFPTTLATTLTGEMYLSKSRYRAMWYMVMTIRQDEFSQLNGGIVVILNMKNQGQSAATFNAFGKMYYASQSKWYSDALPYKVSAMHCFYDEKTIGYKFMSLFYFLYRSRMDKNVTRFVPHYTPSLKDIKAKLQSYGIPTIDLPFVQDDLPQQPLEQTKTTTSAPIRLLYDNHRLWTERQRIIEIATRIRRQEMEAACQKAKYDSINSDSQARNNNNYIVGPPQKFDVLLGRGSRCAQHPGNIRAFTIADMNRKHYDQLGKHDKTRYAEEIVTQIQKSGGRFLKKAVVVATSGATTKKRTKFESFSWVEATPAEAREKVSHIFRRLREIDAIKSKTTTSSETASTKRKIATMSD